MLEKPALADDQLIGSLRDEYGVQAAELQFLPLGADPDTAVFRLSATDGREYFVKLRSGAFDEMTVAVPHLLAARPDTRVIAPIPALDGRLFVGCGEFAVILYPFVAGQDGFERPLAPAQFVALGAALKSIHATAVPPHLAQRILRETFSPAWRELVRGVLRNLDATRAGSWPWPATDSVAHAVVELLQSERNKVVALVERAEQLAAVLTTKDLPYVLCHADIHVWNVLVTEEGALYVVDWDTVLFAPKERDLMFIGSGLAGLQQPEQAAFYSYSGYGPCNIDTDALAYYRCERIVQDIAVYCRELLLSAAGGADRAEGLRQLTSQFEPASVVDIALQTS